ncbi:MAG: hypothetical protein KIT84_43360 [Labilithrix sp.]|nr:hypothetical protein [Labilithrix sp.]MCW5817917.1 hypothetical protein [Labilithrix sp.]
MAFLYSGSSPVQTGVAVGIIAPERVAVLRGRVFDADEVTPRAGITVRINGHPEFGQTITRADGTYDLAVNGGTSYVVDARGAGYLPVQRRGSVGWHGWGIVEDIVLTRPQSSADLFISGSDAAQVVRGLVTPSGEDADGERQALIVFPPNTHFTNYAVPDGTPLEVQVTEYTRGPRGQSRMPGELPPTSGYTYAFELGFPAATAAGVADVTFDRDVSVYVDNFTHYPVGETVPLGYYDRAKGAWMAEKSGRILKIVGVTGGMAMVDVTGDGVADTGAALADLGITTSELSALAGQHPVGAELWRVTMSHFSAWDCNWGFGPPDGAVPPPTPDPADDEVDDPCERDGSIIGCESRTLGETLPLIGTPFNLRYLSSRSSGFKSRIRMRLAGDTPPPSSLQRVRIEIEVAGRRETFVKYPPIVPKETFEWTWDNRDAYGRDVGAGRFDVRVRVGYEYAASTTFSTAVFGAISGFPIDGNRDARTITIWQTATSSVMRPIAPAGFGGWMLDVQHAADMEALTLYRGDGRTKRQPDSGYIVDAFAGGGIYPNFNDGGDAQQAYLGTQLKMATGPDGTLYFVSDGSSSGLSRVRAVGTDGSISTLAGVPPTVPKVDGAPALHAEVRPAGIAVGADGAIYFAEEALHQVWKIVPGPTPTLQHVAGKPAPNRNCFTNCGDGGDARQADLPFPRHLAVANDGTVFVTSDQWIRRIGPEGTISTYGVASLPFGLHLQSNGTLLVENFSALSRIDPSGTQSTVRDPVTQAPLELQQWCEESSGPSTTQIVPLDNGGFMVGCYGHLLRRSPQGAMVRIAGQPDVFGLSGDGGPAIHAHFQQLSMLAFGQKGELFVGMAFNGRPYIRRLRPLTFPAAGPSSFRISSEDGSEIYEVDAAGRHLRTLSALRGTPIYTFVQDPATGHLQSVTDASGNETRFAYTSDGVTVTAPHGQITTLMLDSKGHLARLSGPMSTDVIDVVHDTGGLLTDLVRPGGRVHHFDYDDDGRLIKDSDAIPGSSGTRLAASTHGMGWSVDVTSPEDRVTRHRVDRGISFGDTKIVERRTITRGPNTSSPVATVLDRLVSGFQNASEPDGTKVTVLATATDPRWGTTYASSIRTDVGFPAVTHSMLRSESRTATLATPDNPFAVSGQTITTTVAGAGLPNATSTRVFAAGSPATWTTTSPVGRQTRVTLDTLDRFSSVSVLGTDPVLHPIHYHYDDRGRVDQITHGTRVYTTSYDPATGWVESTTNPAGLDVSYASRDANGRPTLINLPGGRALGLSYDPSGNVLSVTPPSKPPHSFSWDPTNRLAAYAPPDLSFAPKDTTYTRDNDGLLLHVAQPGTPTTFAYDALGRPHQRTDAVARTYAYDPQGRLSSITTSDGVTLTNTYDGSLLARQAITGPFSHELNKTYDNFLRVSASNVDGADTVALTYDRDGFVTAAGPMTVTRGSAGLLKSTTLGALTETFGYNAHGEVVGHALSGSATTYAVTYARDAAGRIETKTETIDGVSTIERYTYDAAGRLWQVFVNGASTPLSEWTYDANGNRTDGSYDLQDRQLSHEGFSFAYGPNGERFKKTDDITHVETLYDYDAQGNLRSVTRPAPLAPIDYVIDGRGRRIGKKVGGTLVQGFLYDGARIVAELDASGVLVSRFVYATGGHSPDFMVRGGVTYRFVKDHLGTPRLVFDSSGILVQRLDVDPWGNITTDTNPDFQPFGFAGGLWDRDAGLARFGARDYDPTTGRWTTKDASRFGGGLNFYAYANNDPINYVDVTGHTPAVAVAIGVGIGLVAGYLTYTALQNYADSQSRPGSMPDFPHMPYDPEMPMGGPTTAPPWDPPAPPVPDTGPLDDSGGICGGDKNKKDDRKRNKCIAACRHLLPDPQGDLQSSNFHRCVAECMAR